MKSMESPQQFADFSNGIYVRSSHWLNFSEINFQLSEKVMNAKVCLLLIIQEKIKRIQNSLVQRYLHFSKRNYCLITKRLAITIKNGEIIEYEILDHKYGGPHSEIQRRNLREREQGRDIKTWRTASEKKKIPGNHSPV